MTTVRIDNWDANAIEKNSLLFTNDNVAYYHQSHRYASLQGLNKQKTMAGVRRVICFCFLTFIVPAILIILPLYLRHYVFAPVSHSLAESDIITVTQGINSVFCEQHHLKMNGSFNALKTEGRPRYSKKPKQLRLKKSMVLPDDTLEYWGFNLLSSAFVVLRVCSMYPGGRILIVKGERNLRTCGLLEHNQKKFGVNYANELGRVEVLYESQAEEINITHKVEDIATDVTTGDPMTTTAIPKKTIDLEEGGGTGGEVIDDVITNKLTNMFEDEDRSEAHSLNMKSIEPPRKVRHAHKKAMHPRQRRSSFIGGGINHGGGDAQSDSQSSFEYSLFSCYDGQIIETLNFTSNHECNDIEYLDQSSKNRFTTTVTVARHNITSDGYYYYIFYSDNDLVHNKINVIFEISKPTYDYTNVTTTKKCINSTDCTFSVEMMSDETVYLEVPTRDGIEDEDEIAQLISTCIPRTGVYAIFPILVLLFILSFAFL